MFYGKSNANHREKATGRVGKYIVAELLKRKHLQVTAITRHDGSSDIPAAVQVKKVNYDDQATLVEALKGQDALVISLAVTSPPGT